MTDKTDIHRTRKAFEALIKELGDPDNEFNQWFFDEGNLYWLWGEAIAAYESELKRENEALMQNHTSMQQTNQALIKELNKFKEALTFYAIKYNFKDWE